GIGVFKAGGDLSYHHGGISLQEIVIPVISFRYPVPKESETHGQSVRIEGVPQVLTNRTFGARLVLAQLGLFAQEPVPLRVSLMADNEQVGHVGLAVNGELDRESGLVRVEPDVEVSVALVLTRDDC